MCLTKGDKTENYMTNSKETEECL